MGPSTALRWLLETHRLSIDRIFVIRSELAGLNFSNSAVHDRGGVVFRYKVVYWYLSNLLVYPRCVLLQCLLQLSPSSLAIAKVQKLTLHLPPFHHHHKQCSSSQNEKLCVDGTLRQSWLKVKKKQPKNQKTTWLSGLQCRVKIMKAVWLQEIYSQDINSRFLDWLAFAAASASSHDSTLPVVY